MVHNGVYQVLVVGEDKILKCICVKCGGNMIFNNLCMLLDDMKIQKWWLESFIFTYNGVKAIVIIKRYKSYSDKKSKYAQADIEFIRYDNIDYYISAYCDWYKVEFLNRKEYYEFFNINSGIDNKEGYNNFNECFAKAIPNSVKLEKNDDFEKKILARRIDKNDPDGLYCYDIRRTGKKINGENKLRTDENSKKAQLLRPFLYNKYRHDYTYSFFFSPNKSDELSDEEIIKKVAKRDK